MLIHINVLLDHDIDDGAVMVGCDYRALMEEYKSSRPIMTEQCFDLEPTQELTDVINELRADFGYAKCECGGDTSYMANLVWDADDAAPFISVLMLGDDLPDDGTVYDIHLTPSDTTRLDAELKADYDKKD